MALEINISIFPGMLIFVAFALLTWFSLIVLIKVRLSPAWLELRVVTICDTSDKASHHGPAFYRTMALHFIATMAMHSIATMSLHSIAPWPCRPRRRRTRTTTVT